MSRNLVWQQGDDMDGRPPLTLTDLSVTYSTRKGGVHAVRGITLDLHAGREPGPHRRKRFGQVHIGSGCGAAPA